MLGTASLFAALARPCCRMSPTKTFSSVIRLTSTSIAKPVALQTSLRSISPASRALSFTSNVYSGLSAKNLPQGLRQYVTGRATVNIGSRLLQPRFFSANSTFQAAAAETVADLPVLTPPTVGYWLLGTTLLIYAVIVVGGVTRLTESGLSITEWKPVSGIIPPLTQADWEEEFEKYRATPEFKL